MGDENAIHAWQSKHAHYMTLNPHYVWENKIQWRHDNLHMHIVCEWQNAIPTLWP
jgi:hypothetical protein